ncbi:MAG TPA: APC family permease [Dokdonella sp.]|uniref:APC family permease n=1 Tax=Dokdonella sp. TaxID=2291710 RepID=UPI002D7E6506|nr:APC family permease [Dokdonella sp.]HET9031596.1 APC family permease [Dokdonella sp.]
MTSTSTQPPVAATLEGESALVRAVGGVSLAAAIINIIVGSGIFLLPALLFTRMGSAAPIAFLAGALAIVPIALCFAAIGSRAATTGGPYTYVGAAFGPFPGFVAGALMWICNVASSGAVASALFLQVARAWPQTDQPLGRAVFMVVLYSILIALNAFGVKMGTRAINALAALKLTPLFLLAGVGLFFVDWSQINWITIPSWPTLGASMVLVMFAYSGMETALIPSGELRDASHSVPRATLAAILVVVLLYMGIQIVTQGILGPALATSTVPLAEAAGTLWTPGLVLLLITAGVSMGGFMMGNLLASSRLLYALGRDGYLPSAYGRVTASYRVPLLAIVTHGVVGFSLAMLGNFEALALISGGANCLIYLGVSLATWFVQKRDLRAGGKPFVLPGGPLIPAISALAMIAIIATLSRAEWTAILIALLVLVVIYAGLRHWRLR